MITPVVAMLLAPTFSRQIRVDGDGFFRLARGTQAVYATELTVKEVEGKLVTTDGLTLLPKISGLDQGRPFEVGLDGTVSSGGRTAGRLVLVMFPEGTRLHKEGAYLVGTQKSNLGSPGEGIFGVIRSTAGAAGPSKTSSKPINSGIKNLIQVAASSEVEGDAILLGDIADINVEPALMARYKAVDLGMPPIFGSRRGITESYIAAKMRNQGLNPEKITILCPPSATVVRKGQTVSIDAQLQAAIEAAKEISGVAVTLKSNQKLFPLKVPLGELVIQPGQVTRSEDLISVNLAITVDGKTIDYRQISLVPVAISVKAKVNDPIKLRITKGSATIEVDAKVILAGPVGSQIMVETDTKARFTALFVAPGVAEVKQ